MTAKKKKAKTKKTTKKKPAAKVKVQASDPAKVKITPTPTAGKKIIDFEQKLDEQIAGPPEPEKRGRGRPRKEAEPEPEISKIDNQIIKDAICIPFDLWARSQKLKGLKLSEEEAQTLAEPVKTLLDYYLPEVPTIVYAWGSLAITAYALTSPRLFMIEEERARRSAKNEALRTADQTRRSQDQGQGSAPGPSDRMPRQDEIKPLKIAH